MTAVTDNTAKLEEAENHTQFAVLGAISFSHFLNDMMQSLILAIYPMLKGTFDLNFTQIGLITLTYQVTASILQPVVGLYTDKHPKPYSLAIGMSCTLTGLLALAFASNYPTVLLAAALVGTGSSIFHPESSRIAKLASGKRHGLAQSIFQVGGNAGSAIGPLLAAWVIIPHGQHAVGLFSLVALLAIIVLMHIGHWYRAHQLAQATRPKLKPVHTLPRATVLRGVSVLMVLVFSKFFYLTSLSSYYTFYLMSKFHLPVQAAQHYLFLFLAAVAAGTILGGPIGDRIGRRKVIWGSILGVVPFTLLLPHVGLTATAILSVIIGIVLASAFPAIVVYAQELMPNKTGTVAGLFYGFAFGMGGIGAAALGYLADLRGIEYVYQVCAYLPLLGLFAVMLPEIHRDKTPLQQDKLSRSLGSA
jgi:FSR family fosmidomycin resistance protein-like MFS transporter